MRMLLFVAAAFVISLVSADTTEAQLFNRNLNYRGGIPNVDMVPQRSTPQYHIRNTRILRNGQLQFAPNSFVTRNGNYNRPRNTYNPPRNVYTPARSPYAAGPTVGGRIPQVVNRPRSQSTSNRGGTGWQPWMHVPLDGSQPWNGR